MKVKALRGFAGAFSMHKGQILECNDNVMLQDLLSCNYVEEVKDETVILPKGSIIKEAPVKKGGIKNETKRSNTK